MNKEIRDQKRTVLIDLMHDLSAYVLYASKNDRAVILSSKYDLAKSPTPTPPIAKATDVFLTDGSNAGELQMKTKKVTGARAYLFQYTQGDPLLATTA